MELEVYSPPRDLAKWCVCSCTACSLIGGPSNTWFRSVKRKHDEFGTGNGLYVPGFDLYSNARVQIVNECAALRETISSQQAAIQDLYTELEEERNASSSAATEAMSMILKLQREKAEIQMEATQFKRFAEGKIAHDQQEIMALEDLLYKTEQDIQALTCEALAYKHMMMGYGLTEAKAEGEKDDLIQNLSVDENLCARFDPPACNYLPLKCNLNQNPSDDVEDVEYVEKYAFGETPHAQEHLRNLEQRICQMNDLEKVIVGHSPKRSRHSRRLSTDTSNSVLAKEMGSEFTRDSSRFNASFKKTEFVLEMDELSSSGRMDNASAVRDDVNDSLYD